VLAMAKLAPARARARVTVTAMGGEKAREKAKAVVSAAGVVDGRSQLKAARGEATEMVAVTSTSWQHTGARAGACEPPL